MGFAPPQHSSLLTLAPIYRDAARALGDHIHVGATSPSLKLPPDMFLDLVNRVLMALVKKTGGSTILVILTPAREWCRYVARPIDIEGGAINFALEGQTKTFVGATDSLAWQYEIVKTGVGVAPGLARGTVDPDYPDSFPMIALPGESDILETDYPPTGTGAFPQAVLVGDRLGNHPRTPGVFNMRVVGYAGRTPGDDDYPDHNNLDTFFIDELMTYGLRMLEYTPAAGPARSGAIPYNNDAYVNDIWQDILGMDDTSLGTVTTIANPTFTVDGVQWTVSVDAGFFDTYDCTAAPASASFAFTVTSDAASGAHAYFFLIHPDFTPWQTVATLASPPLVIPGPLPNPLLINQGGNIRWGSINAAGQSSGLFGSERYGSERTAYIAINRRQLSIPDDCIKIEWLEEVPVSTFRRNLPDDATDDVVTNAIAHQESLMLNRMDGRKRLWPLGEGRFNWQRYMDSLWNPSRTMGQQYYWRKGNQLYLVGESLDLRSATYMMLYEALPYVIPPATAFADFADFVIDLHGADPDIITDYIKYRHHLGVGGKDIELAETFKQLYFGKLKEAEMDRWGEHSQQGDAPAPAELLIPGQNTNKEYFDPLGDPGTDWDPWVSR